MTTDKLKVLKQLEKDIKYYNDYKRELVVFQRIFDEDCDSFSRFEIIFLKNKYNPQYICREANSNDVDSKHIQSETFTMIECHFCEGVRKAIEFVQNRIEFLEIQFNNM